MNKEDLKKKILELDPKSVEFAALLKYAGDAYPGLEITTVNSKIYINDPPGPFANLNQKVYPYNPNDGISVEDLEELLDKLSKERKPAPEPMCYYNGRYIPIWQHPEVEKEMRKRYKSGLENIGEAMKTTCNEIKKLEKPLPPPPPDPEKKWWKRYFK